MSNRLGQAVLSGGYIELPAVSGTGDNTTVQLALPQWTSCVRADAIECMEGALDVEQGNHTAKGHQFP